MLLRFFLLLSILLSYMGYSQSSLRLLSVSAGKVYYNLENPRNYSGLTDLNSFSLNGRYATTLRKSVYVNFQLGYQEKNYSYQTDGVALSAPYLIKNYIDYLTMDIGISYIKAIKSRYVINPSIGIGHCIFLKRTRQLHLFNGIEYTVKDKNNDETRSGIVNLDFDLELGYLFSYKYYAAINGFYNKQLSDKIHDSNLDLKIINSFGFQVVFGINLNKKNN